MKNKYNITVAGLSQKLESLFLKLSGPAAVIH
jgi:hypothetical protein